METAGSVRNPPLLRQPADVWLKATLIGPSVAHHRGQDLTPLRTFRRARCPWHHACFSLDTGEALRAPALHPISRWHVDVVRDPADQYTPGEPRIGTVYVREKLKRVAPQSPPLAANIPRSVVIVGGGAAGNAAAETLRGEGYAGRITMLSADQSMPCDRPNLSKG